jgi:hypothetical protein
MSGTRNFQLAVWWPTDGAEHDTTAALICWCLCGTQAEASTKEFTNL